MQDIVLSVGIDVSKNKVDVAVLMQSAEVKTKQFKNQSEEDIQQLLTWLQSQQISASTPIVVESTGSYHWLSCIILSENNMKVHLINPIITKQYQRASIRGAKTDTIDAIRLAEIAIKEKNLPLFFDTREGLSVKKYHSLYAKIVKIKQTLTQSYKDAKKSAENIGISLNLDSIQECLLQIDNTIKVLQKIIEENNSEMVDTLSHMKGISRFQASVLCNALDGRTFQTREQLIAFFGLDVQMRQSGLWRGKEKLSKRGNSFYRMMLFQVGWGLAMHNDEFKPYYQRLRLEGKHYYTCLIATARKFLKFFFSYFLQPSYSLSS